VCKIITSHLGLSHARLLLASIPQTKTTTKAAVNSAYMQKKLYFITRKSLVTELAKGMKDDMITH